MRSQFGMEQPDVAFCDLKMTCQFADSKLITQIQYFLNSLLSAAPAFLLLQIVLSAAALSVSFFLQMVFRHLLQLLCPHIGREIEHYYWPLLLPMWQLCKSLPRYYTSRSYCATDGKH